MKHVLINGQWLNTLPLPHTRPYMTERVFALAEDNGWKIQTMTGVPYSRGHKLPYRQESRKTRRRRHALRVTGLA